MKPKIFIDGRWGTTGLLIETKLSRRDDLDLVVIDEKDKKDLQKKLQIIKDCDLAILCLPDTAALEMAAKITNTKIIDASTAHRTNLNWVYGFPEITKNQRKAIQQASRVANPGCYASAVIALLRPLLEQEIINNSANIRIHAISGYSGGGKKLIEKYQQTLPAQAYALNQNHKHLPEIIKYALLNKTPYFSPLVGSFYQGMLVQIACFKNEHSKNFNLDKIQSCFQKYYEKEKWIEVLDPNEPTILDDSFLNPCLCNNSNYMKIVIYGNQERFSLVAILDNLGKGASGAAIQNLNLMLGLAEDSGL